MLTHELLLELFLYDSNTGTLKWKKLNRKRKEEGAGTLLPSGYLQVSINYKSYLLHRVIWMYVYGEWPSRCIDHINGNRSDNRLINLRLATHAENSHNMKTHKDNTSGYKGVYFQKRRGKWAARIQINGKRKELGRFNTPEEASDAYKTASIKYHGNFSRLV